MRVVLDDEGIRLADAEVLEFVANVVLAKHDIHTSQSLVIDCLRAELLGKDIEVEWVFYGEVVHFDKDMRSEDAWRDPRMRIGEDALFKIMKGG